VEEWSITSLPEGIQGSRFSWMIATGRYSLGYIRTSFAHGNVNIWKMKPMPFMEKDISILRMRSFVD
jgi:hypothetical protein